MNMWPLLLSPLLAMAFIVSESGNAYEIKERSQVWIPTPRQELALRSIVAELFFGGAKGGGKSDFLIADWVSHAQRYGRSARGLIVRKTLPELDNIIGRMHALYPRLGARWSAAHKEWHFPNGAILRCRYVETEADAYRYWGHEYNWIGIDEVGNYPDEKPIGILRGCLRSSSGVPCFLRLTGNPGGPGHQWLKEKFVLPSPMGVPFVGADRILRVYILSKLSDNHHVSDREGYINKLAAGNAPHLVKAWIDGDWDVVPEGGFFRVDKIIKVRDTLVPKLTKIYQAWDCAFSEEKFKKADLSVCVTGGFDHLRNPWILDVWAARVDSAELIGRIVEFGSPEKWAPEKVWVEGGKDGKILFPLLREKMRATSTGVNIELSQPGKGSIPNDTVARATTLQGFVNAGLLHVPESAHWLHDFLMEFSIFPTKGAHDDRVSAASHLFMRCSKMQTNKPQPRSVEPDQYRKPITGATLQRLLDNSKEKAGKGLPFKW